MQSSNSSPGVADAEMSSESPGAAKQVVVIGAGPAGLTAAYQLHKHGVASTILEADDVVGGISQTAERDGWRFDIGGHRFFTKVEEVESLWHEILPDEDFLLRPRKSRIFYNGKFFDYPLRAMNALGNLGIIEAIRCVLSYVAVRIRPPKDQTNFEGWTASRFGWRLYNTFFKTYTEKVWGVPATEIQADWAAQRIKNLSLFNAVINALLPKRNQKDITSLIEEFQYPKFGPGMMWETCRDKVEAQGSKVLLNSPVTRIRREPGVGAVAVQTTGRDGGSTEYPATSVVSSMPLSALVRSLDPPAPDEVIAAADGLAYRDFLTVALVVPEGEVDWNDNWIYVHAKEVQVGRIQNFGSWSPYMVKEGKNVLGLEYFVFEGDEVWSSSDEDLVALGTRELAKLGLMDEHKVEGGYVVRMPKAYPVYDEAYKRNVEVIRLFLEAELGNVWPVGRNGMHRYNNQDHSMLTAMLAAENIATDAGHDIWAVNVDEEYHEEKAAPSGSGGAGTGRDAPITPRAAVEATRASRGVTVADATDERPRQLW